MSYAYLFKYIIIGDTGVLPSLFSLLLEHVVVDRGCGPCRVRAVGRWSMSRFHSVLVAGRGSKRGASDP